MLQSFFHTYPASPSVYRRFHVSPASAPGLPLGASDRSPVHPGNGYGLYALQRMDALAVDRADGKYYRS